MQRGIGVEQLYQISSQSLETLDMEDQFSKTQVS